MLKHLVNYKNEDESIGDTALKVFSRHLWYLNEHLVGLSFFDDQISVTTKLKMVSALNKKSTRKTIENRVAVDPNYIVDMNIFMILLQKILNFFSNL